jgi:hypothetical protein
MGQVVVLFGHVKDTFDPETQEALAIAYKKATDRFQGDRYIDLREIIAKRIIASAKMGERDPNSLCRAALASIGFTD